MKRTTEGETPWTIGSWTGPRGRAQPPPPPVPDDPSAAPFSLSELRRIRCANCLSTHATLEDPIRRRGTTGGFRDACEGLPSSRGFSPGRRGSRVSTRGRDCRERGGVQSRRVLYRDVRADGGAKGAQVLRPRLRTRPGGDHAGVRLPGQGGDGVRQEEEGEFRGFRRGVCALCEQRGKLSGYFPRRTRSRARGRRRRRGWPFAGPFEASPQPGVRGGRAGRARPVRRFELAGASPARVQRGKQGQLRRDERERLRDALPHKGQPVPSELHRAR